MTTGRWEDVSMEDCTTARRGWARTLVAVRTLAAMGALLLLLGPGSVAAQVPASVQVIDESVTLFEEARTDSRSRGDVPQGTVLDVLSASGDWYHVLLTLPDQRVNLEGWVHGATVDIMNPGPLRFRASDAALNLDLIVRQLQQIQAALDRAVQRLGEGRAAPTQTPAPAEPRVIASRAQPARPRPRADPDTAAPAPVSLDRNALQFKKVDVFEMEGEEEKKRDARMELDPVARVLTLADEKHGIEKMTYAVIPYDQITKIVYERSSHRRYGVGAIVNPLLFFTKGKKHWLTIEFREVADLPQGYIYMRLDKKNHRRILSALSAGTGLDIEEIIEE